MPGTKKVALTALVALFLCGFDNQHAPYSPQTLEIVEQVIKPDRKYTDKDKEAARELNLQGDKAYQLGNYSKAYTAYDNSYPNFPNTHAYLMWGDSLMRATLEFSKTAKADKNNCHLNNQYFGVEVERAVIYSYDVALSLAQTRDEKEFLRSPTFPRTIAISQCLRALADKYRILPPETCIDLKRFESCLGRPLL